MESVSQIVRETAAQSSSPTPVEQMFSPESIDQLLGWGSTIIQRGSTELSSGSEEAMTLGRFSCLVDDAAHALKRLHTAYENGGTQVRTTSVR